MLKSININNFKSYRSQVLPLSSLTLLIGANASGKSNAIDAFRLLSRLAYGERLSTLKPTKKSDENSGVLRGKLEQQGYKGNSIFGFGCTLFSDKTEWNTLDIEIEFRKEGNELHLIQEKIKSEKQKNPLYEIINPSLGFNTNAIVAYNNFSRGGRKPQLTCNDQMTIMNQLVSSALFSSGEKKTQKIIPEVTRNYRDILSNVLFLDSVPSSMREESYPSSTLYSDGANLAGVLYELHKSNKNELLDFVRSLPEQNITDILFYTDRKGYVSFELEENFGKESRACPQELLSDGTLKVLSIAAALLTAKEGGTVVIEEVDNGIHPSRAKILLSTMQKYAQKRKLQLLISTHNPALMDALPDTSLSDVVFCYRDPKEGDSRLIKLSDMDNYLSLVSQGSLGELVTKDILDRMVKNPETAEERKRKALEWLSKL